MGKKKQEELRKSLIEKLENQKYKIKITFVALSKTLSFEMTSDVPLDELLGEFALQFAKDIDYENKRVTIKPLQSNTPELRKNFKEFVDSYKAKEPKLNQLNEYFKSLEEDENFYLIVNHDVTTEGHINLSNHLSSIRDGLSFEAVKERIDSLFKELFLIYDIRGFDKNTKSSIGEKDKTKRVCRFCGLKAPEVTFKGVAHAISEALGNKQIILNEECDTCNNKSSKIEMDLINYLKFYNIFYGIKGKEKIPSVPYDPVDPKRNFGAKYDPDKGMHLSYHPSAKDGTEEDKFPLNLSLDTNEFITDQNIYKTLCKYALSVIDTKDVPSFKKTIDWIDGKIDLPKLPKVGMLVTNSFFDKHPRLMIYVRKNDDKKLPHLVGELSFTALTFTFIIPLSDKDDRDFLLKTDYDFYWTTFKHYSNSQGWRFLDFSNNTKRELKIKLSFDVRNKTP